ncbi:MAG: hypothetical protein ACLTST_03975 [Lachnospiraceae bacterium]
MMRSAQKKGVRMMASLICTAWACVSGRGIKTGNMLKEKTAKEDWFKILPERRTKNGS